MAEITVCLQWDFLPNNYLNHINGNEQDKYTELQVKAADANDMNRVMEAVKKSLETRGSDPDIYNVSSTSQGLDEFNNILNMLSLFISGVAAISLFCRWNRSYEYYACKCYGKN